MALSDKLHQRLVKEFNKPQYKTPYDAYVNMVQSHRRGAGLLVGHSDVTFTTLQVWRWEDDFDLSAPPGTLQSHGIVTLRPSAGGMVAFQMPADSSWWVKREILVFTPGSTEQCQPGRLYLLQLEQQRSQTLNTTMVVARHRDASRHPDLYFEPTDPDKPAFTPELKQINAIYKCIYRARYLD